MLPDKQGEGNLAVNHSEGKQEQKCPHGPERALWDALPSDTHREKLHHFSKLLFCVYLKKELVLWL